MVQYYGEKNMGMSLYTMVVVFRILKMILYICSKENLQKRRILTFTLERGFGYMGTQVRENFENGYLGTQVRKNFKKSIYALSEYDYKPKINYISGDGCYSYFKNGYLGTQVRRNFKKSIYTLSEYDYKLKINYISGDGCYSYFKIWPLKLA